MRIDVTLWYRLITKGVITPNCYDGNSTTSSSMPTSPQSIQYDTMPSNGSRPIETNSFSPINQHASQFDNVNILSKSYRSKINDSILGKISSFYSIESFNQININNKRIDI